LSGAQKLFDHPLYLPGYTEISIYSGSQTRSQIYGLTFPPIIYIYIYIQGGS